MNNKQFTKSASVIDTVLKILQSLALAGIIVQAVFIPLLLIFGQRMVAPENTFTFGFLKLTVAGSEADYWNFSQLKVSLIVELIAGILVCGIIWFGIRTLREIIDPMKEGRPFQTGIADKMKKLAWIVLIGGGISEVASVLSNFLSIRAYDLYQLVDQSQVTYITYAFELDTWFIFAAIILFFLAFIFRYGEQLQTEADETL